MNTETKIDNLYDVERCQLVEAIRQRMFDLQPNQKFQHYIFYDEIYQYVPASRNIELENEKLERNELELYGYISIDWEKRKSIKVNENKQRRFRKYCKLMGWELNEVDNEKVEIIIFHPFSRRV